MRSTEGRRVLWQGARGDSARVEAWVQFIRRADAFYARLAQQRGEPYTPVGRDEIEAAAALAVSLDLTPTDAMGWLPPISR
ncbi:MAG: hypothetical protein AB7U18_00425 [Dehalococcoidia bacterium]